MQTLKKKSGKSLLNFMGKTISVITILVQQYVKDKRAVGLCDQT